MKILLTVNAMDGYNGSALSTYENARVLSQDHDVTIVCGLGGWTDNEIKKNLEALGVKCSYEWEQGYDLILACHFCPPVGGYKINIVRGITKWEKPLPEMDFYVCIREDVQQYVVESGIPINKTQVVYNGVDRTRFRPRIKSVRDHIKIVAPCNVDSLRYKWLEMMVSIANKDRQLYILSEKTKYKLSPSKYVHYLQPTFYTEEIIADADVVVGIYMGRVNLEARSSGVDSIMYDPYTLEAVPFEIDEETFEERHNIENVVKKLLKIYEDRK